MLVSKSRSRQTIYFSCCLSTDVASLLLSKTVAGDRGVQGKANADPATNGTYKPAGSPIWPKSSIPADVVRQQLLAFTLKCGNTCGAELAIAQFCDIKSM